MIHDHYMYFGDTALVRRYRSTIDAVLDWFGRRVDENGLVGQMPEGYWSLVDWVEEWKSAPVPLPQAKLEPLLSLT